MTPANMVCAHRALQALGAREVRNVTAGHVFVVAVATLVGGLLCTFEHVLSDGTHTQGVALKLRRGLSTPRYIFISHQMQNQLATSLTKLREVATNNQHGSRTRWRWFQDDDDSLTRGDQGPKAWQSPSLQGGELFLSHVQMP